MINLHGPRGHGDVIAIEPHGAVCKGFHQREIHYGKHDASYEATQSLSLAVKVTYAVQSIAGYH